MEPTPDYTDTEKRIFDAALQLFSQKGKDGARMQEIADAAGINKAMLHYYFRSKDKLYAAAFDYAFGGFMDSISASLGQADSFKTLLRRFIDHYVDYHHQHPEVMRLMVQENLAGAPVVRERICALINQGKPAPPQMFIQHMQRAIAAGEIRAVDPFHTFVTLMGGVVFFLLAWPTLSAFQPSLAADLDAALAARKAHLFDLLYHGLQP